MPGLRCYRVKDEREDGTGAYVDVPLDAVTEQFDRFAPPTLEEMRKRVTREAKVALVLLGANVQTQRERGDTRDLNADIDAQTTAWYRSPWYRPDPMADIEEAVRRMREAGFAP